MGHQILDDAMTAILLDWSEMQGDGNLHSQSCDLVWLSFADICRVGVSRFRCFPLNIPRHSFLLQVVTTRFCQAPPYLARFSNSSLQTLRQAVCWMRWTCLDRHYAELSTTTELQKWPTSSLIFHDFPTKISISLRCKTPSLSWEFLIGSYR